MMRKVMSALALGGLVCAALSASAQDKKTGVAEPALKADKKAAKKAAKKADAPAGYVPIKAGAFTMGSPKKEQGRGADEVTSKVKLTKGFYMKESEVTVAEWEVLMGARPIGEKDQPITAVSWYDAVEYANRLSREEDLEVCYAMMDCSGVPGQDGFSCAHVGWNEGCTGYRLPTEAEWEYAARAGSKAARYGDPDTIAWSKETSGGAIKVVRGKEPNAWGLYDMLGNASEWVWDAEVEDDKRAAKDPIAGGRQNTSPATSRIVRGGSAGADVSKLRAAARDKVLPGERHAFVGFRLVRSAP